MTVQELSIEGLRAIGPIATTLAGLEGLDAHAWARSTSGWPPPGAADELTARSRARRAARHSAVRARRVRASARIRLNANEIAVARARRRLRSVASTSIRRRGRPYCSEAHRVLRHRAAPDPRDARQQRSHRRADSRLLQCGPRQDPRAARRRSTCTASTPASRTPASCACRYWRTANFRARYGQYPRARVDAHGEDRLHLLAEQPDRANRWRARTSSAFAATPPAARSSSSTRPTTSSPPAATSSSYANASSTSCCCGRSSKFVSLAGVRCGLIVAAPELIEFAQVVLPPYTFPTPSIEIVQQALSKDSLRVSEERVDAAEARAHAVVGRAARRAATSSRSTRVTRTSFFVKTRDGQAFRDRHRRADILVRTFDDPSAEGLRAHHGRPAGR